jgi:Bacterial Ig-like domain
MSCCRVRKVFIPLLMLLVPGLNGCGDDDDPATPSVDTTRPQVTVVSPAVGATSVPITTTVTVTFSEAIDLDSINIDSIRLFDAIEPAVNCPVKAAAEGNVITFTPAEPLVYSRQYRAVVDSSLSDLAGNTMAADYTWTFSTADDPLPPVAFPLEAGNAWLYISESTESLRIGGETSTIDFEGLRVLSVEAEAFWENRFCWLVRNYTLDQTLTTESALKSDSFYLAEDQSGLYRARLENNAGRWMNVAQYFELEFDDSAFLIAGGPAHSDGSTLGAESVTVPAGIFETASIEHDFTSAEVFETRREYFADEIGLVAATWEYTFDDNDPAGIGSSTEGFAALAEPMNGPSLPYLATELEPNDGPGFGPAQALPPLSILSGRIDIDDDAAVILDDDIVCGYTRCVGPDIDGVPNLQDWYRIVITTGGQYRLDLVYDYHNADSDTWNDLDLYFFEELADGTLRYMAGARSDVDTPEWMILLHPDPGVYYAAVQAWTTPGGPVDYTLAMRPQPVHVDVGAKASQRPGTEILASTGK